MNVRACSACGGSVIGGERYCEGCGAEVNPAPVEGPGNGPVAGPGNGQIVPAQVPASDRESVPGGGLLTEPAADDTMILPAISVPTAETVAEPADPWSERPALCPQCAGVVARDGYCSTCGALVPTRRDHWVENPAAYVAGCCDRGIRHPRNEDAMALAVLPGGDVVLVVCDGVSSAPRSDVGALAAAQATRDWTVAGLVGGDALAAIRSGAAQGQKAIAAVAADPDVAPVNTPSCTLVAAVLRQGELTVGWVGDSRAYWFPDDAGAGAVQLTIDDSWAAEEMAHGVPREVAENGPRAHAITRWLGAGAPEPSPRLSTLRPSGPGWILACTDGLWNYCSEASELARLMAQSAQAAGGSPSGVAARLVAWANEQGGRDNITVALIRVT